MKNLKYWLTALLVLSACTVEEPYKEIETKSFTASIEGSETRTYVDGTDDAVRMHWTAQDAISIFGGGADGKYVFQGETGDRGGDFAFESAGTAAQASRFYAVYPYAESNALVSDGMISVTLPKKQTYVPDSFGLETAWMTAVTESLQDYHLTFKNVMGFLKLQIYGGAKIKSITIQGNNNEVLSGTATISVAYGEAPVITMTGDGNTVKLNCNNVTTGEKKADATAFWIALPPTNFEQGFAITVEDDYENKTTMNSDPIEIRRNIIKPMAAFKVEKQAPPIPELPTVNSTLPVLYIYTPNNTPVEDKVNWIAESSAYLKAADGSISDLGAVSIKGRGNTTWNFNKKPYAIKFDKKVSLFGMPKDKRWDLLANFVDRTRMRNDVALELGRRLGPDHGLNYLDWTPRGEFVELVLNGSHIGNYYLVEHIKIADNRVPITEMKTTDIAEPEVTGGYLLEMSIEMDEGEGHQFWTNWFDDTYPYNRHGKDMSTNKYHLPVMIKSPEDEITPEQFTWIKNYINTLQSDIRWNANGWTSRVDMDSFICWMFIQEVVGNYEPFHPKSSYLHKGRDGKLMMGPLWDFDYATFKKDYSMFPIYHYSIWYPYMLKNAAFKKRVKELWPIVRPLLRDVENNYIDARAAEIKASVEKDWQKWRSGMDVNLDESLEFDAAVAALKGNLSRRISNMTTEVNNM